MASRADRKRARREAWAYLATVPKPAEVAQYLDRLSARPGPARSRRVLKRAIESAIAELVRRFDVRRRRLTYDAGEVKVRINLGDGTVHEFPLDSLALGITPGRSRVGYEDLLHYP